MCAKGEDTEMRRRRHAQYIKKIRPVLAYTIAVYTTSFGIYVPWLFANNAHMGDKRIKAYETTVRMARDFEVS